MNDTCHDLYVSWAMKHLAIVRDTQHRFSGNAPAMQLHDGLEAALEGLAAENPAYKQALAIEEELFKAGFEIRRIEE